MKNFLASVRARYSALSPLGKSVVIYAAIFIAGTILGLIL